MIVDSAMELDGQELHGPELVLALVGAVGTNMDLLAKIVRDALGQVRYASSDPIRLSALLRTVVGWENLPETYEDERYREYMSKGTEFRERMGRGDALAVLALAAIREERDSGQAGIAASRPLPRRAYLLRSLKHPEEVATLRRVYPSNFFLIAAYSPRDGRRQHLKERIARSRGSFYPDDFGPEAEDLIRRDQEEQSQLGQSVRRTFPLADVFIDMSDADGAKKSVSRFIELLFGNTGHTPDRAEYAMFHAQAAALRSGSLSRQVGAVIATSTGDIIAVGTNEVPRAGGGLYWSDDPVDWRDMALGYDHSDEMRQGLVADMLTRLRDMGWLSERQREVPIRQLVQEALHGNETPLSSAYVMNVTEYVRAVHAEMAAIVDAARRGISVAGSTMYTTTFPCHDCAKHIVAAGISKVVYIEPYPKSLVQRLYLDSILVEGQQRVIDATARPVQFAPFVGLAPRRYMDFFPMLERKTREGLVAAWQGSQAYPRVRVEPLVYLAQEAAEVAPFLETMAGKGLIRRKAGS